MNEEVLRFRFGQANERVREPRIVAAHDRAAVFHEVHGAAAANDVFGRLEADGAPADDADAAVRGAGQFLFKTQSVFRAPERVRAFAQTLDRQDARVGARGENQAVVGRVKRFVRLEIAHAHAFFVAIDREHFVALANLDVVKGLKAFALCRVESLGTHDAARVVGQRAVGKGNPVAAFVNNDIGVFLEALQARSGRNAGGNAAHDDDAHGKHNPLRCYVKEFDSRAFFHGQSREAFFY